MWQVKESGKKLGQEHMDRDAFLLKELKPDSVPFLHFYEWEGDTVSYGHFIDPISFLDEEGILKKNLHCAKRPTGGGIIFHLWDFAFSVLVPAHYKDFSKNTLENYGFINGKVMVALKDFLKNESSLLKEDSPSLDERSQSFCMARPTKYDVMLHHQKIVGAAQRTTKNGYLHQGSISLMSPDENYLHTVLKSGSKVLEGMKHFTYPLLGPVSFKEFIEAKEHLKQQLIVAFQGD